MLRRSHSISGFSLLELAIIIGIISVVIGLSVSIAKTRLDYASVESTAKSLDTIKSALLAYQSKYQRLPCPAKGVDAASAATYGYEVTGGCSAVASCPTGLYCSNQAVIGVVPFATLGLNKDVALDAWGNKVTYAVDYAFTNSAGYGTGRIIVRDTAGNEMTSSGSLGKAIFILVSHGKDGAGSWPKNGTTINACVAGDKDGENCNNDNIFIDSGINESDTAANYYDDITSWYTQVDNVNNSRTVTDLRGKLSWGSTTCAIDASGLLFCWGSNSNGQLGGGTTDASAHGTPTQVGTLRYWKKIATEGNHVCGINQSKLYCWGDNSRGQLGLGDTTPRTTPTAITTGSWTDVSVYGTTSCGINGGKLYCWGDNTYKIVDPGATATYNTPVDITGSTAANWTSVRVGSTHACGINGGSLYCWGTNTNGQLGTGNTTTFGTPQLIGTGTWSQISVGSSQSCGVQTNGRGYCWGMNTVGQVGDGTNTSPRTSPTEISGAYTDWQTIDTLYQVTHGIRGGKLFAWGYNVVGSAPYPIFGSGTATTLSYTPLDVTLGNSDWVYAMRHCAVRNNGSLYCAGENALGRIGDGTNTSNATYQRVLGGAASTYFRMF